MSTVTAEQTQCDRHSATDTDTVRQTQAGLRTEKLTELQTNKLTEQYRQYKQTYRVTDRQMQTDKLTDQCRQTYRPVQTDLQASADRLTGQCRQTYRPVQTDLQTSGH